MVGDRKFFALATILLSAAVYAGSLNGDFVWDDKVQVVDNPAIREVRNIPSFFTSDIRRVVDSGARPSYYYRPFFLVSLTFDHSLWGLKPLGYHVTNLILHALAAFLVYCIGWQIFREHLPAFFTSALFAVHPLHVESVAWISGRTDPMATVFLILSFCLYILYREGGRILILVSSVAAYAISLLSKEISITLPLLLGAYELSFRSRRELEQDALKFLRVLGVYVLISAMYLYVRLVIFGTLVTRDLPSSTPPITARIYTSFGIILDYLRITILPVNLKVLYDFPLQESFLAPRVLIPAIVFGGILGLSLLTYRSDRSLFFGALWFFITILPVSNIVVPLAPTPMAERHMYLPSVGLCMVGAGFLHKTMQVAPHWSSYFKRLALLICVVLSVMTFYRTRIWRNEMVLFSNMKQDAPNNFLGYYNLGNVYRDIGEMTKAIAEWEEAVTLEPLRSEPNNALGNVAYLKGDYPEAIRRYRIAVTADPNNVEAHYNLALALEKTGQIDEAVSAYRSFIAKRPAQYRSMLPDIEAHLQSLLEASKLP